jgi:UDP-3-O-[3-hydroxymyristoyl] glucosamine N-acyltransferase
VILSLEELAARLGAELVGDPQKQISGVRSLDEAGEEDLSFLHNPKYLDQAQRSNAGAILVKDPELLPGRALLVTGEPYLAMARALELFFPAARPEPGVHPTAVVAEDASLDNGVSVGPCAIVGARAKIGSGSIVGPGCVIGADVELGADCLLHPRVVIEHGCQIGDRCILHSGTVIGSDGYGFATVDGVHHKIPQVGIVVVEDDVEMGASCCIDRATLGETRIGRGTKLDNLVHVAHNVTVGEGCLLVAGVGISGSTQIGNHTVFAGHSGSAGHLKIGNRVQVAGASAVFKNLPDDSFVGGVPARPLKQWQRANANLNRLERFYKRVDELEGKLDRLVSSQEDDDS